MSQTLGTMVSDMSLEEYLQHVSSLCGERGTTVRALNDLEKEQFRVVKLKQVTPIPQLYSAISALPNFILVPVSRHGYSA